MNWVAAPLFNQRCPWHQIPRRTAPFPPTCKLSSAPKMCSPPHSQAATKWRQSPPSRRIKIGLPEPEILWWYGTWFHMGYIKDWPMSEAGRLSEPELEVIKCAHSHSLKVLCFWNFGAHLIIGRPQPLQTISGRGSVFEYFRSIMKAIFTLTQGFS